jgi:hypothetical protein
MNVLEKHLKDKGLWEKANENKADKEAIKADYKAKNKVKKLTQDERITRIEMILGIVEE